MTGKQLVKHCAQSVHVCCAGQLGLVTHGLLWRHITRRSHDLFRFCDGAVHFD